MKQALITRVSAQDGSYLAKLLLKKGDNVYGIVRPSSSLNTVRMDHIYRDRHESNSRLHLKYGDLNSASSLNKIFCNVAFGFRARTSLEEGIRETVDWYSRTQLQDIAGSMRL